MKTSLPGLFVAAALLIAGCNSSSDTTKTSKEEQHEHIDNDGHNHKNEAEHNHSDEDGHDHSAEGKEAEHADEIAFTAKQAKAVGLETEIAKAAEFRSVIKTSGQIEASQGNEQTVVATNSGIVSFASKSIANGAYVRAGETLVTISGKSLQDGDSAQKAKIAFEAAQKEFQRAERLIVDTIISVKEYEQIRARYETAKASYQGLASSLSANGIRVSSPMSGYIKNRLVNQGDYVAVGQPIATITQNHRLQLKADVSELHFKNLRNIASANFKTAHSNTIYSLSEMNGKLVSYGKTADGNSFYIPVIFEFDNVGDAIPGTFVDVYLLASPRQNVISVPVSALTEEQGLHFVYIQIEPEAFVKQEVEIGQSNGQRVEITKGLAGGEAVVVKGTMQVKLAASSGAVPEGHSH